LYPTNQSFEYLSQYDGKERTARVSLRIKNYPKNVEYAFYTLNYTYAFGVHYKTDPRSFMIDSEYESSFVQSTTPRFIQVRKYFSSTSSLKTVLIHFRASFPTPGVFQPDS